MGEIRNAYKILVGKSEGKRPLGRSRHKWKDNIKMALKEIVLESVDWIHIVQCRNMWLAPVNTVINLFRFNKRWGISSLNENTISFSRTLTQSF
jgi:hypothetical protein